MNLNAAQNLTNQRARAAEYIKRRWSPIPVKFMGEEPLHKDWQNLRIEEKDIDRWFPDKPTNIAVRLGKDSDGLVDIYMVDEDARRLAKHFLPDTHMKIGTPSRPSSHWMYEVGEHSVLGTYLAASGFGTLIELVGRGEFTLFPGSVDASGEAITFEEDDYYPRSFNYEDDHFFDSDVDYLLDRMRKLAVAAVVLKRFNSAERPYLIESAAKFLCGCGWGRRDIQNLIESVAQEAGLGQGTGRDVFEFIQKSGRSGLVHCLGADVVGDMESWYIEDPMLRFA